MVDAFFSAARTSIALEMYELNDPTIIDILTTKAAHGVRVSVVLDSAYSGGPANQAAAAALAAGGVKVVWAPSSIVFHGKFAVVDSTSLLVGTGNFTSQDYATTRDLFVVDNSRADVTTAASVIAADLSGASPISPPAPGPLLFSPGATARLVALISGATHSVQVENEEMSAPPIIAALTAAARRGVDVVVTMTYEAAWTSAFDSLTAAGVHVRVYHGETPIYIHAKAICVDCTSISGTAEVGSQNFSVSSLDYNREAGVITTDQRVVGPLATVLTGDAAGATPW